MSSMSETTLEAATKTPRENGYRKIKICMCNNNNHCDTWHGKTIKLWKLQIT